VPAEKATALVLRVIDFSESSCVVTLFTREFGKISALAKGGRRPKGPFEAALDLLAICSVVFLRKSSDALDLLTEAKLQRRFRPPGKSLAALHAGYYVAELVGELTDQYDPHPELFDLCVHTLESLSGGHDASTATLRFELASLHLVGHQPSLAQCAECGRNLQGETRPAFGLLSGGMLCANCRAGKRQVVLLSGDAWRILQAAAGEAGLAGGARLPSKGFKEARVVMNRYVAHLVGRPLRMHEFLGMDRKDAVNNHQE
jgi:DNA repair protein RecO (recombination protein O)